MAREDSRRLNPRPHSQGWVQDTTLYIPPTSTVREVHLEPEWAAIDSKRLAKALGLKGF